MEKWIYNTLLLKRAKIICNIIFFLAIMLDGCAYKSNSCQQEDGIIEQEDSVIATDRRPNSEISFLSTVIRLSVPPLFRKESEVDSLMQWWFMLGEAETVDDYINVRHPEKTIGKLSECSPESLLAFNYYLVDILERQRVYKKISIPEKGFIPLSTQ